MANGLITWLLYFSVGFLSMVFVHEFSHLFVGYIVGAELQWSDLTHFTVYGTEDQMHTVLIAGNLGGLVFGVVALLLSLYLVMNGHDDIGSIILFAGIGALIIALFNILSGYWI